MAQYHTFWWSNISELGQNVVCNYLLCWNPSNQEKVSGNTILWFFPFFWSAVNLAGVVNSKCQFCTRFRTLDANPKDWDHKKIMLNGETHLKVSKHFFSGKKKIMSQIDQEGSKIISRNKFFFPIENDQNTFCLEMIFGPSRSLLDKFFWILNFFGEFFLVFWSFSMGKKFCV